MAANMKNDVERTYILIVEDCQEQGELLRHTLTRHDYTVKVAMNGYDALAMMHEQAPNIVFTDIMMPEMDGFELCREIKKNPVLAHVPVVLLTASWDMNTLLEGLESGADLHFFKPWDKGSLLSRTAEMVQKGCFTIEEKDTEHLRVQFDGRSISIPLNRQQILHQLISTYEVAVKERKKNMKLQLKSK
ncbi:MAG: response regulator [Nitrospinae bacterium]|jgi:CheY-like chemotaxis protein|nr:response regulator [Nitrospinota bacterium]MDA1108521.1 response regulator [Nitrospinota bacterium]